MKEYHQICAANAAVVDAVKVKSKHRSDDEDLAAFLAELSGSCDGRQDIQLAKLADYFGTAFSMVHSAQYTWARIFRESTVAEITDIPLSHISDAVYKTSTDWINQCSVEALASFVTWSLDIILVDLAKRRVKRASPKSQGFAATRQYFFLGKRKLKKEYFAKRNIKVAFFVVPAMVLRRKPDVLVNLLPILREHEGQDKLTVVVWMVAQASQGDLSVGLYSWARNFLPLVSDKSSNPESRDLILQLLEKILSYPKARTILVNGAVRKGERLMPPSSLEILMRITYPASSARLEATERFEAVYPTLKEVALAGATGSKEMKQVAQQILTFAVQAAGEDIPELSREAAGISIWCFTQNAECYKQWDNIYRENLQSSITILKRLSEEWKEHSMKLSPFDSLRETLEIFLLKNKRAMGNGDPAHQALLKDADKYCKEILGKVSSAILKPTERFEAVYPTLKEVALDGATGSKEMKQVAQQILTFAVQEVGEEIPELSREAAGISIWCFTQNADCYKQWDKIYRENLQSSIAILKRLSEEWKDRSVKLAPFDPLRETLRKFRLKNKRAMGNGDPAHQALLKDADKYCKDILGKISEQRFA